MSWAATQMAPARRNGHAKVEAAREVQLTPSAQFAGLGVSGWGTGIQRLVTADFPFPPLVGVWDRLTVLSIPAIGRGRDLICAAIGSLPLTLWRLDWNTDAPVETMLPPALWMNRPDPNTTRAWIFAWTVDDLIFYARSYWLIVARYSTGYPSAFRRLVPTDVHVNAEGRVVYQGHDLDPADVIEFASFTESILTTGFRTLSTTLKLEDAADRFAGTEVPAGWLKQTGGEPLSGAELSEWADLFTQARRSNTTAALNQDFDYHESSYDPERMQLVEARGYQALEAARLMNVPPWSVGAPSGTSMTYQNAQQARAELIDFGALPFINTIEQTLGGPNVVPNGQFVRLDTNAWLRNPLIATPEPKPNDLEEAFNPTPTQPPPTANGATP